MTFPNFDSFDMKCTVYLIESDYFLFSIQFQFYFDNFALFILCVCFESLDNDFSNDLGRKKFVALYTTELTRYLNEGAQKEIQRSEMISHKLRVSVMYLPTNYN